MSRYLILILLSFVLAQVLSSQNSETNKLVEYVNSAKLREVKTGRCSRVCDSLLDAQKFTVGFQFLLTLNKQYEKLVTDSFTPDLLNITGNFYNSTSNYTQSLDLFQKSLRMYEEKNRPRGTCNVYTNIGNTYYYLANYDKALDYYRLALKVNEETIKNNDIASNVYNNIGIIYSLRKNYVMGYNFFKKAFQLYVQSSDSLSMAHSYNNFATIFSEENKIDSAFYYFKESLRLKDKFGGLGDKTDAYNNMADIYLKKSDPTTALFYLKKTLTLLDTTLYSSDLQHAYLLLAKVYEMKNNPALTYKYYKLGRNVGDTIEARNETHELQQKEIKFQVNRAHLSDSLSMVEETKIQHLELAQKKKQNIFLLISLAAAGLIALVLYNRFRITNKQKQIIDQQKKLVELKQKEVLDSIHYAKRIQQSLLTSEKYIERILNKLKKIK